MLDFLFSIEGWVGWLVCLVLYLVSVNSIGKLSLTHWLVFHDLAVLKPTEESVAVIAGAAASSSGRRKRSQRPPKTVEERLAILDLSSSTIYPGMLTMHALKTSPDDLKVWRYLDSAIVFTFSCVIALITSKVIISWSRLVLFWKPCCNDLECWASWMVHQGQAIPLLGLLAFVTMMRLLFYLGGLVSQLPKESAFRYAPSNYVVGYLFGLLSLWLLNSTRLVEQQMQIPIHQAVSEGAARMILFTRLVGIRLTDEQVALESWVAIGRFVLAGLFGCVAFLLSDSLDETVKVLLYRFHAGPTNHTPGGTKSSTIRVLLQSHVRVAYALVIMLPQMILMSYLTAFHRDRLVARTILSWIFCLLLCFLVKPLLQSYLEQSIPSAVIVFAEMKQPTADAITQPFTSRIKRLARTGSKLAIFPCTILTLLTMGHLCNRTGMMYPAAFHLHQHDNTTEVAWRQTQAIMTSKNAIESKSLIGYFTPTRFNTCGQALQEPAEWASDPIKNGMGLLINTPPVRRTLAQVLSSYQDKSTSTTTPTAISTEPAEVKGRRKKKEAEKAPEAPLPTLAEVLRSLVSHPFLTSTIVLPVLDLLGLVLTILWWASLIGGYFYHGRSMRELASYNMMIADKSR